MKHKKRALFQSIMSLILCFSMLVGTTFAWFTDSVSSASNIIQSGRLDIEMHYSEDLTQENGWKDASTGAIFNYEYWEPGYTDLKYLKIDNTGNLAFTYQLTFDLPEQTGGISNTESDGGEGETKTLESQNLEEGSQLAETVTPENSGNDDELLANMPDAQSGETGGEEVPPVQPAEPAKQNKQADALLLAKAIDVYYANVTGKILTREEATQSLTYVGTLSDLLNRKVFAAEGILLPEESLLSGNAELPAGVEADKGYTTAAIMLKMREDAGNEYMNLSAGNGFCLKVVATQYSYEKDAFGNDFDTEAVSVFPAFTGTNGAGINLGGTGTVETNEEGKVTTDTTIGGATIPQGTLVNTGVNELTVSISEKASSDANLTCGENEALRALDVHIEGVSPDNTVPIQVDLGQVLNIGLNQGNVTLYHMEADGNKPMTQVSTLAELDAHNEFYYDPATGNVTVSMATFSEVTMLADTIPAWEGGFNYDWYAASETELIIANADQLAAFGAIVGGMNGQKQDSFTGKTVKLIADINLGDAEAENNPDLIFYPIGYNCSDGKYEKTGVAVTTGFYNFEGTFDGQGHTISNFYQNTWEMKGDNNNYDATLQYYRDGMGLFGKVYGGTVKNLTVENFKSDGEYTTTGVIAAYADGATFENIAIVDCNPRVYNIGNGGIVGCVGWYAKEADLKTTFTNITVDNSNIISALWGSYDVACGGIVGQYYPTSGQSSANAGIHFENCHVAAQMDVYNDVCGNYQYYAYRYAGMMIGSIRENTTNDEGKTIPDMTGISASGCTANFGTWNDYYYCELVDNSQASYTHDYQMSRLTEIKAINGTSVTYLDGTTDTVPASGRANYVIVDYTKGHGTENVTCYHFKDGAVWTHDMGGIQTGIDENGDGQDDLKEDKQHIYLEFNNLFTGYGWGVSSMGINNWNGITALGVDEGEQEASVEKFEGKVTELANNKEYSLGDIFSFVDKGVELKPDALTVTVTNLAENNPVSAMVEYDKENWENGTLKLIGMGRVQITIQDYYFCLPTTITIDVTDRQPAEKFDVVMNNGDFLHRVGNSGTVALDKFFKAKDDVTVGTVSVTVEAVNGSSASGAYSNNAIQFTGTGNVKVTITDNDYCIPAELTLEVVDAVNATSATSAKNNNVVLLNDCGFSSLEVSGGYTLYGNGFTMTCGSDSAALDMGYSFVTLNNGTLDNVQIICPNFDYAALYKSNLTSSENRNETTDKTRYYNAKSGVMVSGNSQILNSRISGGRAAVNVSGGNVVIDNSRIELGAVASILVGSANSLTLRDVTLIQKPTESTHDKNKTLMGFSVLYMCDSEGKATPTTLEGSFVQQAWVNADDKKYVPSAGQDIVDGIMKETAFIHNINGKDSLNLGFAYMPEDAQKTVDAPDNITDNRTDKATVPYEMKDVKIQISILSTTVYVYSYKNTYNTHNSFKTEEEYKPNKYGDNIIVTYADASDDLTTGKSYGADGWVYELNVDLDKVSGYKLDFSKLSMSVNGVTTTDFKVNGAAKPTSPAAVTAGGTTYTLTATIDGKEYTATFIVTGTETSKESPSLVASNYEAGLCVASSYGGTWHGAAPALQGIQIKYWSVAEKQYKTINLSDYTPTTKGQLNGTNTTWTYSPDNGDFTLTLTGGQVHSSNNVYAMPVVCDGKLYFVAAKSNGLVNSGNSARTIPVSYSFKDNNNGDVLTFSHTWSVAENKDAQYKYSDFCNGTLTKLESSSGGSSGCVTPDTLITLANGKQVRVDSLTGNEQLLVWNMETGKLDSAPIMFVDSDPKAEYEVIHLYFSDGTDVKVISEHGFWDYDLNRYVYLDRNADKYIGHTFAKQSGTKLAKVKLTDVVLETEVTTAWSPVTAGHLCYFVNGMLSMPGGVGGLFNIFDVDPATMTYDYEAMAKDIEAYGLFTYEEMNAMVPLSEDMFNAAGGAYLKISIGKGNMTLDDLVNMIQRYSKYI